MASWLARRLDPEKHHENWLKSLHGTTQVTVGWVAQPSRGAGVGKCPILIHFGNIGHHLIVAIIDHIPNGWVMFNGDILMTHAASRGVPWECTPVFFWHEQPMSAG